jgi:hypothetical protein
LNLFLQDAHGLFNVIVDDPDFNVLQISRPLFPSFYAYVLKIVFFTKKQFKRFLISRKNTFGK